MMWYSKTVLALAFVTNVALLFPSSYAEENVMFVASDSVSNTLVVDDDSEAFDDDSEAFDDDSEAFDESYSEERTIEKIKSGRPNLKKRIIKTFRVVSNKEDMNFIPSNNPTNKLIGSQLIQNGAVHKKKDVNIKNDEIDGDIPNAKECSFYNSHCTVMNGEGTQITQNMCKMTLCLCGRGCLFFVSGGAFSFNPFDSDVDAVPTVRAMIMSGTGNFQRTKGFMNIDTLSRSNDGGDDRVVLELAVAGK